jgi:coenzyme PQQ biosynthesis protein PqqD
MDTAGTVPTISVSAQGQISRNSLCTSTVSFRATNNASRRGVPSGISPVPNYLPDRRKTFYNGYYLERDPVDRMLLPRSPLSASLPVSRLLDAERERILPVTLNSRLQRGDFALSQRASDTPILLNIDSGQYYVLNDVGGRIWELCDGIRSVAEIITILCQEYEAPAETITTDVVELMTELVNENLLVASE